MPNPPQQSGIGRRILTWLEAIGPWMWAWNYAQAWRGRADQVKGEMRRQVVESMDRGDVGHALLVLVLGSAYVWFGDLVPAISASVDFAKFAAGASGPLMDEFAEILATGLEYAALSKPSTYMVNLVGTVVTTPIVKLLEDMANDPDQPIENFVRRFHGIATGLPWAADTIDSILRAKFGEHAPSIGKNIQSLYWGLGLGFLGWQTLAPLLESGLQPGLHRKYARIYKPARFTASQMADLYALGKRSQADVAAVLADLGWRDVDIQAWIDLSYRTIPESDLWDLYYDGHLSKSDMDGRLRALGYNPSDLPLVYHANPKPDVKQAPGYLLSTAKGAFKSQLIPESEFRNILNALHYSSQEADLQVQLITADRQVDARQLTVGQIRELYNAAVISRTEAQHHLAVLGYETPDAKSLVDAWDVEAAPKAVRLNRGTILEGFTDGVLSRDEAIGLLRSECGYDATQANLIVRIEQAQAPRPVAVGPQGAAPATLTQLAEWYKIGLINQAQLTARPELTLYAPEDRARIVQAIVVQPEQLPKPLTAAVVLPAYQYGVLDRAEALDRLQATGLSKENADLTLLTFERAHPDVFGGAPAAQPKALSLTQLGQLAAAGLLTEDQFLQRPEMIRYAPPDRQLLGDLIYQEAASAQVELSAEALLQAFLFDVITEQQLSDRLSAKGLSAADAETLIATFKLQHPEIFGAPARVILRQPTVGAVQLAYQRGLIDADGFRSRLGAMGYNDDAIQLFQLNAEFQVPANPKPLTQAQVIRLYRQTDISRGDALRRLVQLGYTINDAELLIRAEHLTVADSEAAAWFEAGLLDLTGASAIWTDEGFTVDEIDAYLSQFGG